MKWIMGILLSLIVIGFGGFYFFQNETNDQASTAVTDEVEAEEENAAVKEKEEESMQQDETEEVAVDQNKEEESDQGSTSAEMNWEGEWSRNLLNATGHLEITNVVENGFHFMLDVVAGANTGTMEGEADRVGETATWSDAESDCELSFTLTDSQVKMEQNDACQYWGGAGTFFDGDYEKGEVSIQTDLVEQGVLEESEDALLRNVVGEKYDLYLNNMSSYSEKEDQDGLGTRVVVGFIRGIASTNGGIIMVNEEHVYAAVTDSENGVILYHTNDPTYKQKLPDTIAEWKDGMMYEEVVFE
ncbi:MAG: hypothetical protein WBV93_07340 [Anaerobacillus sp.]